MQTGHSDIKKYLKRRSWEKGRFVAHWRLWSWPGGLQGGCGAPAEPACSATRLVAEWLLLSCAVGATELGWALWIEVSDWVPWGTGMDWLHRGPLSLLCVLNNMAFLFSVAL